MFSTLLRSVSNLFVSREAAATRKRSSQPWLESLEQRDVPTSLAVTLQNLKVIDYQLAITDVSLARTALSNFNQTGAQNDLNAAKNNLTQAAQVLLEQYGDHYETQAQAQHDLAIINAAYNQCNSDLQVVHNYFTAGGALGSLLSWDGQYLGNMPNMFGGANMLQ